MCVYIYIYIYVYIVIVTVIVVVIDCQFISCLIWSTSRLNSSFTTHLSLV